MLLQLCEVSEGPLDEESHRKYQFWCKTHKFVADHCAPDGDSRVCSAFALVEGCNCCSPNYGKSGITDRQKLDWFVLKELKKIANLPNRHVIDLIVDQMLRDSSLPDGMIEVNHTTLLDGEDAKKILGVVFNWIFEEGIAHKEDLQDRLQDAGYGMSKVEAQQHYRK